MSYERYLNPVPVYECRHVLLPIGKLCGYAQRGPGTCPFAHPSGAHTVELVPVDTPLDRHRVLAPDDRRELVLTAYSRGYYEGALLVLNAVLSEYPELRAELAE